MLHSVFIYLFIHCKYIPTLILFRNEDKIYRGLYFVEAENIHDNNKYTCYRSS